MIEAKTIVHQTISPLYSEPKVVYDNTTTMFLEEHIWEREDTCLKKPLYSKVVVNFEVGNSQYKVTMDMDTCDFRDNGQQHYTNRFLDKRGRYFEFLFWEDGVYEMKYWDNVDDYHDKPYGYEIVDADFIRVDYIA